MDTSQASSFKVTSLIEEKVYRYRGISPDEPGVVSLGVLADQQLDREIAEEFQIFGSVPINGDGKKRVMGLEVIVDQESSDPWQVTVSKNMHCRRLGRLCC